MVVPGGQGRQAVAPGPGVNNSKGHKMDNAPAPRQYDPAGQTVQEIRVRVEVL